MLSFACCYKAIQIVIVVSLPSLGIGRYTSRVGMLKSVRVTKSCSSQRIQDLVTMFPSTLHLIFYYLAFVGLTNDSNHNCFEWVMTNLSIE